MRRRTDRNTSPVNVPLVGLPYFGPASGGVSVAFGSSRKP
jgi:hypothetical protein